VPRDEPDRYREHALCEDRVDQVERLRGNHPCGPVQNGGFPSPFAR
jgi:hypothetical protein